MKRNDHEGGWPTQPLDDSGDGQQHYREGGWFKFDLAKFFEIPTEPGKYQVEAILGPYHLAEVGVRGALAKTEGLQCALSEL